MLPRLTVCILMYVFWICCLSLGNVEERLDSRNLKPKPRPRWRRRRRDILAGDSYVWDDDNYLYTPRPQLDTDIVYGKIEAPRPRVAVVPVAQTYLDVQPDPDTESLLHPYVAKPNRGGQLLNLPDVVDGENHVNIPSVRTYVATNHDTNDVPVIQQHFVVDKPGKQEIHTRTFDDTGSKVHINKNYPNKNKHVQITHRQNNGNLMLHKVETKVKPDVQTVHAQRVGDSSVVAVHHQPGVLSRKVNIMNEDQHGNKLHHKSVHVHKPKPKTAVGLIKHKPKHKSEEIHVEKDATGTKIEYTKRKGSHSKKVTIYKGTRNGEPTFRRKIVYHTPYETKHIDENTNTDKDGRIIVVKKQKIRHHLPGYRTRHNHRHYKVVMQDGAEPKTDLGNTAPVIRSRTEHVLPPHVVMQPIVQVPVVKHRKIVHVVRHPAPVPVIRHPVPVPVHVVRHHVIRHPETDPIVHIPLSHLRKLDHDVLRGNKLSRQSAKIGKRVFSRRFFNMLYNLTYNSAKDAIRHQKVPVHKTEIHLTHPQPGRWSAWSPWGHCSVSCGRGQKYRFRKCVTAGTSGPCVGKSVQVRTCHRKHCRVAGRWSSWSYWSACSVSCGIGHRQRARKCVDPNSGLVAYVCSGRESMSETCAVRPCDNGLRGRIIFSTEGDQARLRCNFNKSYHEKSVYWVTPSGDSIAKGSKHVRYGIEGDTLIVFHSEKGDSGLYKCVILTHKHGLISAKASLVVIDCSSHPCHNGGICMEHVSDTSLPFPHFTCRCPAGYYGKRCTLGIGPAGIAACVVGVILAILFIVIVVILCNHRNSKKVANMGDHEIYAGKQITSSRNKIMNHKSASYAGIPTTRTHQVNKKSSHSDEVLSRNRNSSRKPPSRIALQRWKEELTCTPESRTRKDELTSTPESKSSESDEGSGDELYLVGQKEILKMNNSPKDSGNDRRDSKPLVYAQDHRPNSAYVEAEPKSNSESNASKQQDGSIGVKRSVTFDKTVVPGSATSSEPDNGDLEWTTMPPPPAQFSDTNLHSAGKR